MIEPFIVTSGFPDSMSTSFMILNLQSPVTKKSNLSIKDTIWPFHNGPYLTSIRHYSSYCKIKIHIKSHCAGYDGVWSPHLVFVTIAMTMGLCTEHLWALIGPNISDTCCIRCAFEIWYWMFCLKRDQLTKCTCMKRVAPPDVLGLPDFWFYPS